LAKVTDARAAVISAADLHAKVVWFCLPDRQIVHAAKALAGNIDWRAKIALHSSGALASDELEALSNAGASVASVHPLMTFVPGSSPTLARVPFAIEGDAPAVRIARSIVSDLGGTAYAIRKADKVAYHAWGTFASPLLTALLATTEQVAALAGVDRKAARQRMIPILLETLANYASAGAAAGFSGPLVRGDAGIVKRHIRVLRKLPVAREVYVALARAAMLYLPVKNRSQLKQALNSATN
jgi:predicted short-subunit dehydrogenase-like oxidoreductase (DUF2520 family)